MSDGTRRKHPIANVVIPLLVVAGGIAVFTVLKMTKPEAKKTPEDNRGLLVEAIEVEAKTHDVDVLAQGRVLPARTVVLSSEVPGRVVWQHEELAPGGHIAKGATVVRVDARDYKLALQQQEAAVDRAELELEIERSRKKVAEREWELLGGQKQEDPSDNLALREPQLRTAKVAVEAAKSGMDRARLAVGKTAVKAPFNAMIQSEQTELGQLVGPQTPLATLVGTDHFWVQVAIPIDNLANIRVPGVNAEDGAGSDAHVWQEVGGQTVERTGRIVRLLGDLDPTGGMARVLVEIDDPLGLQRAEQGLPMLLGAFVNVRISAGQIQHAIEVPRTALRGGDRVYVIAEDSTMAVKEVTIIWRTEQSVLVSSGIQPGDRVITSRVGDAIPGTKVRTVTTGEKAEPEPAAAEITPKKDAT